MEFVENEMKAYIRFATKEAAESALKEYAAGDKELGGNKVTATLLSGTKQIHSITKKHSKSSIKM